MANVLDLSETEHSGDPNAELHFTALCVDNDNKVALSTFTSRSCRLGIRPNAALFVNV